MGNKESVPITIGKELHICPECGYEDGFHTSFVRLTNEVCKIILICPSCHARFDNHICSYLLQVSITMSKFEKGRLKPFRYSLLVYIEFMNKSLIQ